MRFGKKEKLCPRYIGPYVILERVGELAYKLDLPLELLYIICFTFACSEKYEPDSSHVIRSKKVEIQKDLTYAVESVQILDREVKQLYNKMIPLVKVLWHNQHKEKATWEREEEMRMK